MACRLGSLCRRRLPPLGLLPVPLRSVGPCGPDNPRGPRTAPP